MINERALNRASDGLNRACASHVPGISPYVPTIPTNFDQSRGKGKVRDGEANVYIEVVFPEIPGMPGTTHAEKGFKTGLVRHMPGTFLKGLS
jgi:hypothetical protein